MSAPQSGKKIAVVAVHGVAPHPRYRFQDQVATALTGRLNARDGERWRVSVVNPEGRLLQGADEPEPTISRVHRIGEARDNPVSDSFDVIEAYWSPINKGHTKWFSVLSWLSSAIFTPLDTTARLFASGRKTLFDYAYIGGALVLAFALFALSLYAIVHYASALLTVTGLVNATSAQSVVGTLRSTASVHGFVPISIFIWLLVGSFGGYMIAQGLRVGHARGPT